MRMVLETHLDKTQVQDKTTHTPQKMLCEFCLPVTAVWRSRVTTDTVLNKLRHQPALQGLQNKQGTRSHSAHHSGQGCANHTVYLAQLTHRWWSSKRPFYFVCQQWLCTAFHVTTEAVLETLANTLARKFFNTE